MKTTFGVIVSSRGFFPIKLAEEGRKDIIRKLESAGYSSVVLADRKSVV